MRAYVNNTGEDIPLESRQPPKAPDPGTEVRNNPPLRKATAEMWEYEERIPGMVKESTVWDVYNNEARKVDNELVKDWMASLNFLLVFAAIFAAVLTAFIIESKKMLEENPTEILVDITIQYFNSIGSQSKTNLTRPDFEPTSAAISINCLLFASLGASLVAALASVVALQWVADYDAAITRGGSSPLDRAKRRQFRFAGIVHWRMGEIIAALPLLLYSSVILFWAGAIQWMWTLHHIVGYVVAGGTLIAVLFYVSTTLLDALFVSSPFRTPLSRGVYWLSVRVLSLLGRFLLWLPIEGAFKLFRKAYKGLQSYIQSLIAADTPLDDESICTSVSPLGYCSAHLTLPAPIPEWITTRLIISATYRHRENETAKHDPAAEQEALAWLAQELPISGDSHERLLLCVSGILALSTENPPSPRFNDAPWLAILNVLSEHFLRQILNKTSSNRDYHGLATLLQCIDSPFIRSKVIPAANYVQNPSDSEYWTQCRLEDGAMYSGEIDRTPMAFLLARDVPIPSPGSIDELEATWKFIRWRNSIGRTMTWLGQVLRIDDMWVEVFSDISRYSPEFLESCLCHFQTWNKVLRDGRNGDFDFAITFNSIVEQALDLHRDLTTREVLALVRAFSSYLNSYRWSFHEETVDETNIIPQLMMYAMALDNSPESIRAIHLGMTLLVARTAKPLIRSGQWQWMRWVTLMLWVIIPKRVGIFADSYDERARKIWNEDLMESADGVVHGPHIGEISGILWPVDNDERISFSTEAFTNAHKLRYLELLLQWVSYGQPHRPSSEHILLHLYRGGENPSERICVSFNAGPNHLEGVDLTGDYFNPILAMLVMSDTQDLTTLDLLKVDPGCASSILEIIKEVKRQPVVLLRLLTDIIDINNEGISSMELVLVLESVKQAMTFLDEESTTSFLLPLASGIERIATRDWCFTPKIVSVEAQRIHRQLQAKYAAKLILSPAQLRGLSCARSSTVVRPAMGWLRMHEAL